MFSAHCRRTNVMTAALNRRTKLSQCAVGTNRFERAIRQPPLPRRSAPTKIISLEWWMLNSTRRITHRSRLRPILLCLSAALMHFGRFAVADGRCWPCVSPGLDAALRVALKRRNQHPRQRATLLQASSSRSHRLHSFILSLNPRLLSSELYRHMHLPPRTFLMRCSGRRLIPSLRAGCLRASRC